MGTNLVRSTVRAIPAVSTFVLLTSVAQAAILFEDTMYWRPGGITVLNPAVPPTDAYVKIQETVYDDAQGRQVLSQQLALNLIHGNGGVIPAAPFDLYGYSITNLTYGNGPFTNSGLGISGFEIPNPANVPFVIYGPNMANDRWHEHAGDPDFEWQIDADGNLIDGDGIGIVLAQSHNSFYFVVPGGTTHGFIQNASVNTWQNVSAEGFMQTDFVFGFVSGPIPEPTTAGVVAIGCAIVTLRPCRARG
jgi:hypothetical protein